MFNKLKSQVQAAVNEKVLKPLTASPLLSSASSQQGDVYSWN